ncbi:MAG: bis(5'-nucleosyl)-tetraphosphatase (symmetrical) YqeK [Lachnospiraceae bacterium]|nr:bis(5'-nucleosyl)-tetraphosphatase (symmetrical) YqeK [Lachnospiraceae bacterium]
MKIEKIEEKIKKVQSEKRFAHTKGVQYTAMCLAMKYDEDIDKASLAGLLHDCAKHISEEKLLSLCLENDIPVSETEKSHPFLLHGKVGALIAKKKFGLDDEDLLNAITYHTTGRPGMSVLEKIIFVADYIEPGRNSAENLKAVRKMAFEDLDLTIVKITSDTLNYLNKKKAAVDPMTKMTYDHYMKESVINVRS